MDPNTALTLTDDVTADLVRKKVTCPFLGSAVHPEFLAVHDDADNPLASIEDVRRLGTAAAAIPAQVPNGLFSLELPGSQGSHPGHSGILQGNPETLDSGRVSEADFARLPN